MAQFTLRQNVEAGQWWPGRRTPLLPNSGTWCIPQEKRNEGCLVGHLPADNGRLTEDLYLNPGDWLVCLNASSYKVIPHAEFLRLYKPVSPNDLTFELVEAKTSSKYLDLVTQSEIKRRQPDDQD